MSVMDVTTLCFNHSLIIIHNCCFFCFFFKGEVVKIDTQFVILVGPQE